MIIPRIVSDTPPIVSDTPPIVSDTPPIGTNLIIDTIGFFIKKAAAN